MAETLPLTIINEKNLRGILAPPKILPQKILEDLIDYIELSSKKSIKETAQRIKDADRNNSWIPAEEVEKRLKTRLRSSR